MLTYQNVLTVNPGVLTKAAKDWENMADGFEELEDLYKARVESVANDGTWVGVSAGAASSRFSATRKQLADAQVEARAVASILRNATERFSRLIGHVKDLVAQAREAEMSVNGRGEAVYDFSKLALLRHDVEYSTYVSQAQAAEAAWTRKIKEAVQAVDDADQDVKIALHGAAGVKNVFERLLYKPFGQGPGFNGDAVGDISTYARVAREQEAEAKRREKEKEPEKNETLEVILRGIGSAVHGFSRPGDLGTKFLSAALEGVAGATGFNNTQGISLSGSLGFGAGVSGEISLVHTRTPDGRSQINFMYSGSSTTAGWDLGASANIGVIRSNADDISQLKGTGWDKGASFHGGIGIWGGHQTAIGATNSQGDDVATVSGGVGLGVGNEISTGFSQADGWTLWEEKRK
ncbi:hypothetical protein KBZ10_15945 [Streptomyces sp. F63]|uniref:hypothetical protein n=1 Tax=Streptomyces sp. F63 TaxID=2824887 RepID=UPI001B3747AC|nr:hypothetical protein [Streptomyces sp. F63]MBQ0985984.1 hypothetical protein [Streptomyces sp. F63]